MPPKSTSLLLSILKMHRAISPRASSPAGGNTDSHLGVYAAIRSDTPVKRIRSSSTASHVSPRAGGPGMGDAGERPRLFSSWKTRGLSSLRVKLLVKLLLWLRLTVATRRDLEHALCSCQAPCKVPRWYIIVFAGYGNLPSWNHPYHG